MSNELIKLRYFKNKNSEIRIAFPVFAFECEAKIPIDTSLDAYEEAILKLINIDYSVKSIEKLLNVSNVFVNRVIKQLKDKKFVVYSKSADRVWHITGEGKKILNGMGEVNESNNSSYGYMFYNPVRKDVLPFFFTGDIYEYSIRWGGEISKLEINENSNTDLKLTQLQMKKAYLDFVNFDIYSSNRKTEADEIIEKYFDHLDSYDEEESEEEQISSTLADYERENQEKLRKNKFVRRLASKEQRIYLYMRIIIDPRIPGGYYVESPFDLNDEDTYYYTSLIKWLCIDKRAQIKGEFLGDIINTETRKLIPYHKPNELDYEVYLSGKLPEVLLFKKNPEYSKYYNQLKDIFNLMKTEDSLIQQQNIVVVFNSSIVEKLLNEFFRIARRNDKERFSKLKNNVKNDLKVYQFENCMNAYLEPTQLRFSDLDIREKDFQVSINNIFSSHGNSVREKFINLIALNFYYETTASATLFAMNDISDIYSRLCLINRIRNKASHDTEVEFSSEDYNIYIESVTSVVNVLAKAIKGG